MSIIIYAFRFYCFTDIIKYFVIYNVMNNFQIKVQYHEKLILRKITVA